MREKILKMLTGEYDLEPALMNLKRTAERLMEPAQFGGFTHIHLLANLQEICDTCDSLLEEVRKMKQELQES